MHRNNICGLRLFHLNPPLVNRPAPVLNGPILYCKDVNEFVDKAVKEASRKKVNGGDACE